MKTPKPIIALAFLLPASLVAQGTPGKAELVGTWVTTVRTDSLDQSKSMQAYLTLHTSGVYSVQNKTKTPSLYKNLGLDYVIKGFGMRPDSTTGPVGQYDSTTGDSPREWNQWTLVGDSLQFGRGGRYVKYPVVLQGSELKLALPASPMPDATDKDHHQQCASVFTRVDTGKPLPTSLPSKMSCQTVAGPVPAPKLPTLRAADLLGTWVSVERPLASMGAMNTPDPLCAELLLCAVTTDTLTFQADSTLAHNFIRSLATTKAGKADTTAVNTKTTVKLRWWVAGDTLWTAPPEAGKKPAAAMVSFEDNGRYLVYKVQTGWGWSDGNVFQRATASKP